MACAETDLVETTRCDAREGGTTLGERFFDDALLALGVAVIVGAEAS